jgi:HPr kinase/phosphorylase
MRPLPAHGVLLELNGIGLYLIGSSGLGKSEIALELIYQGASLICDDAPNLMADTDTNQLSGHCPEGFYGLIHLHDLGIINLLELFNSSLLTKEHSRKDLFQPSHTIDFIIELVSTEDRLSVIARQTPQELLSPNYLNWQFQHWTIPGIRIHLYPDRNIPLIIKTAVLQFSSHLSSKNRDQTSKNSDQISKKNVQTTISLHRETHIFRDKKE